MSEISKNKFMINRLVYHNIFKVCQILDYKVKTNGVYYALSVYDHRTIKDVAESDLRNLTLREFLCHRRPTGEWKCGKNNLFASLFYYSFFASTSIYSFLHIEENLWFLPTGIACLVFIGAGIRGVLRNYRGLGM